MFRTTTTTTFGLFALDFFSVPTIFRFSLIHVITLNLNKNWEWKLKKNWIKFFLKKTSLTLSVFFGKLIYQASMPSMMMMFVLFIRKKRIRFFQFVWISFWKYRWNWNLKYMRTNYNVVQMSNIVIMMMILFCMNIFFQHFLFYFAHPSFINTHRFHLKMRIQTSLKKLSFILSFHCDPKKYCWTTTKTNVIHLFYYHSISDQDFLLPFVFFLNLFIFINIFLQTMNDHAYH